MYKNHYFLQFVTAGKFPQEVKEKKGYIQHFKTDALELNWSDSCSREAYSDTNPLLTGEEKGQTKVARTVTLTRKKINYDGSCSQADQHIKSPWLSQEVPIFCKQ